MIIKFDSKLSAVSPFKYCFFHEASQVVSLKSGELARKSEDSFSSRLYQIQRKFFFSLFSNISVYMYKANKGCCCCYTSAHFNDIGFYSQWSPAASTENPVTDIS